MKVTKVDKTYTVIENGFTSYILEIDGNDIILVTMLDANEYIHPVFAESIDPDSKPEYMTTSDLLKSMDDAEILKSTIEHLKQKLNEL